MLKANDLKMFFKTPQGILKAVDGVSFEIKERQIIGLVGESGSGKSTLGKMLIGLLKKTEGDIEWNSKPMPKNFKRKDFLIFSKNIQMIFQDPYSALNPRMQVWQLLQEPFLLTNNKQYLNSTKKERLSLLQAWLEKVGLRSEFYDRYPHEFSGGQLQRIGIARALIQAPKLLICDEPISALDVSVQAQIVNLLKHLQSELGMSMLFIAHDLAMVNYLCDEVMVMYRGKIVEQGLTQEVFLNPLHPYTQLLLESNPSIGKRIGLEENLLHKEEMPSLVNLHHGCSFAFRCNKTTEKCSTTVPELTSRDGRKIACFNV